MGQRKTRYPIGRPLEEGIANVFILPGNQIRSQRLGTYGKLLCKLEKGKEAVYMCQLVA